jgi:hypothetical protein
MEMKKFSLAWFYTCREKVCLAIITVIKEIIVSDLVVTFMCEASFPEDDAVLLIIEYYFICGHFKPFLKEVKWKFYFLQVFLTTCVDVTL